MTILSMALGIIVLLWIQRAVYRRFWDNELDMQMRFSAEEAFEGDRLSLIEELTNAKPLPLPWVAAKFQISKNLLFLHRENSQVSDDFYQNDLFSVNMFQRITRKLDFRCGRRGFYRIKSMTLASSNLFISDRLVKHLPCHAQLTVLPRTIAYEGMELLYRQIDGAVTVRRFTNPDPFDFRGIREYQPRDDFRSVNFKATAKAGALMVNIRSATASQELAIFLNLQSYSAYPSDDVFEESIRLAATAAGHFMAQGLAVSLVCNGLDVTTDRPLYIPAGVGQGHWRTMMRGLARINEKAEPSPMGHQLAAQNRPEPVYLLISSYDGPDFAQAFETMLGRGLVVKWILPALPDAKINVGEHAGILRWEVSPNRTHFYQKAV